MSCGNLESPIINVRYEWKAFVLIAEQRTAIFHSRNLVYSTAVEDYYYLFELYINVFSTDGVGEK